LKSIDYMIINMP